MMKIVVNLQPSSVPFKETDKSITYLKQLGVDQLATWPDQVPGYKDGLLNSKDLSSFKKGFEDHGMSIAFVGISGEYSMGSEFKRGLTMPSEKLRGMVEAVGEAGINLINLFSFSRAGGMMGKWAAGKSERAEEWERIVRYHQKLVEYAESVHVKLAIHQSWMPDGFFWNYESQKAFLDAMQSKYIGVNFCVGSSQLSNDDPPTCIRRLGEKILLVHARDVKKSQWKGELKATGNDFENWEGERYVSAIPGEGECDWPRVTDALKDIGYNGGILIENIPHVEGEQNNEIGTAYTIGFLKGLLADR